jgi:hypothetical protein
MSTRIKSVLDSSLDYDFLFAKDTKLDSRDNDIESDVYEIRIFGNTHHIVIGNNYVHADKENITYFIVYLLYDSKVVCKIGVYEIDTTKLEKNTNRTFDFTKLDLLLDQSFYKNPDKLNPFIMKEQEVVAEEKEDAESPGFSEWLEERGNTPMKILPSKQESNAEKQESNAEEWRNKQEWSKTHTYNALKGKQQTSGVEETKGEDKSSIESDKNKSQSENPFLSWLEENHRKKKIEKSKRAMYNIFINFLKIDSSLDKEYENYFDVKKSETNKLTIEYNPGLLFENKNRDITRSMLILFEYLLDIKFVEVDSNQDVKRVTFLNDLEETKLKSFIRSKTKSSLILNPVFKKYNPTKIVLVKEDKPNSYSMVEEFEITSSDETNQTLLDKIKTHLREKPNEYKNIKPFVETMKL